jgi:hypothetical protein
MAFLKFAYPIAMALAGVLAGLSVFQWIAGRINAQQAIGQILLGAGGVLSGMGTFRRDPTGEVYQWLGMGMMIAGGAVLALLRRRIRQPG